MNEDRRGLLEQADRIVDRQQVVGTSIEVSRRIVDELLKYPDLLERLAVRGRNEKKKKADERDPGR